MNGLEIIIELKRKRNFSVTELAEFLGYSRQAVHGWLAGGTPTSEAVWRALTALYEDAGVVYRKFDEYLRSRV